MKTINTQIKTLGLVMISAALLAGCGKRKETLEPKTGTGKSNQNTPTEVEEVTWDALPSVEEVVEFYKADSDFFTIKTTADIPGDLKWEAGSNVLVFSSPKA